MLCDLSGYPLFRDHTGREVRNVVSSDVSPGNGNDDLVYRFRCVCGGRYESEADDI